MTAPGHRRAKCDACGQFHWCLAIHYVKAEGPGRCPCRKGKLIWNDPPAPTSPADKMRAALAAEPGDGYSLERMTQGLDAGLGRTGADLEERSDG